MNTKFNLECTKSNNVQEYAVRLQVDILEGLTDDAIRELAERSERIKLQGKLRMCNSATELEEKLHKLGYTEATVSEGVEKEISLETRIKNACKTPEKRERAMEMLKELGVEL